MSARVFWAVVAGFILGVFVRSVASIDLAVAVWCALLALVALLFAATRSTQRRNFILCGIAGVAVAGGIVRMDVAQRVGDPFLDAHIKEEVYLRGSVVSEPDRRETRTLLTVAPSTGEGRARVLVSAPVHTDVSYGDTVEVRGVLKIPEAFDTGVGRTFDYAAYLAKDRILYTLATDEVLVLERSGGAPLKAVALSLKHLATEGFHRAIPEPESALAAGITVGDKRAMGEDLTEAFTRSSLVHIVVLSGYNITVVINACLGALQHAPAFARLGTGGVVVAFFILMTGGAATAVRAGLMALIAVYARASGRVFLALRALAFASFVMVLWNPFTLLFDPSFQLSALATLGLVLYTPLIAARLPWLTERFGVREVVSSTIATQFTVLPLLLYQSGNLSLVALPANLLVLAVIPLAMALSMIAAVGGLVLGPLAPIAGAPAFLLLSYVIGVAETLGALPAAALTIPGFSAWLLVPAYAAIAGLYVYVQKNTAGDILRPQGRS